MLNCLVVGIGGFIGTVLRYLIGLLPIKESIEFPVKTLVINVIGSFLIGIIVILATKNKLIDSKITLMLKVGVCGGFTTFSTFAYETAELMQNGKIGIAVCYVSLSIILGVMAIFWTQMLLR